MTYDVFSFNLNRRIASYIGWHWRNFFIPYLCLLFSRRHDVGASSAKCLLQHHFLSQIVIIRILSWTNWFNFIRITRQIFTNWLNTVRRVAPQHRRRNVTADYCDVTLCIERQATTREWCLLRHLGLFPSAVNFLISRGTWVIWSSRLQGRRSYTDTARPIHWWGAIALIA